MKRFLPFVLLPVLLIPTGATAPRPQPVNLGFEEAQPGDATLPLGFYAGGNGHTASLDSVIVYDGKYSLRLEHTGGQGFGVATQSLNVVPYRGRTAVLTGQVRRENVADGFAGLWARTDGDGRILQFDNYNERGLTGTGDWTECRIVMPIGPQAELLLFGGIKPGDGIAWIDDLRLVFAPNDSLPATSQLLDKEKQPAKKLREERDPAPPDRLLTDEELRIEPTSADEHPAWTAWLKENAHRLRSIVHDDDFSDLAFLADVIGDKRVVQLGESSHGISEFNLAKVRLIKYLHRELGFDVIAFESGMLGCYLADQDVAEREPEEIMNASIFQVWHSTEALGLFEYLAEARASDRPLTLAGFDNQFSANEALTRRADFLHDIVACVDTGYARQVRVDTEAMAADRGVFGRGLADSTRAALVASHRELAGFLDANFAAIEAAWTGDPLAPRMARESVRTKLRLLGAIGTQQHSAVRDSAMADNIEFLLDEVFPDRKVIVWAHNGHIHHGPISSPMGQKWMGEHLAERRRDDLYTVGLYMGRGFGGMNNRQQYEIADPPAGSLGAILEQAGWGYLFVDLAGAPQSEQTAWMDETINARTWGTNQNLVVLRDQYDALLYIDRVQDSDYR